MTDGRLPSQSAAVPLLVLSWRLSSSKGLQICNIKKQGMYPPMIDDKFVQFNARKRGKKNQETLKGRTVTN